MRNLLKMTAVFSLIFVSQPTIVLAATKTCITAPEIQSIAMVSTPTLLQTAKQKCQSVLSKDAYLIQNNEALVAKFEQNREAFIPSASAAFKKIMVSTAPNKEQVDFFNAMPLATMVSLFQVSLVSTIKMDAKTCYIANEVVELLEPLPPQNMARLFTILMQFGSTGQKQSSFVACPYQPRQTPKTVGI